MHERIDSRLRDFILAQPVFFVATVPSSTDGHINLSPKGLQRSFAILDEHRVAYLDYTGSGAETHAHLRDDGRIVLMFCAFAGPPNIVRLHGHGRAVLPSSPEYATLRGNFEEGARPGLRAIIEVNVHRVSDACGYSVPFMEYVGDRDLLTRWAERKNEEQLQEYRDLKNSRSIDGLPAL